MGNKCIVKDCPNNNLKRSRTVSLFRLPPNPILYSQWTRALEDKTYCYEITNHCRVCEYHFQPEEITRGRIVFDEFGNETFVCIFESYLISGILFKFKFLYTVLICSKNITVHNLKQMPFLAYLRFILRIIQLKVGKNERLLMLQNYFVIRIYNII